MRLGGKGHALAAILAGGLGLGIAQAAPPPPSVASGNTALRRDPDAAPTPIPTPLYVSRNPCAPYDLRKDHGAPYAELPILEQGNYSFCAAFSVESFVDGWIQSHLPNPPAPGTPEHRALRRHVTSPFLTQLQEFRDKGVEELRHHQPPGDATTIRSLIDQVRVHGSCDHLAIFGRNPKAPGQPRSSRDQEKILAALGRSWSSSMSFLRDRALLHQKIDQGMSLGQILYEGLSPPARDLQACLLVNGLQEDDIPGGHLVRDTNPTLMRLLFNPNPSSGRDTEVDFLLGFFEEACREKTLHVELPPVRRKGFSPNESLEAVDYLQELMDRPEKDPVHVSFCGKVLEQARPFKAYLPGDRSICGDPKKPEPEPDGQWVLDPGTRHRRYLPPPPRDRAPVLKTGVGGTHGAVIIGRRRQADGSCQVLLRGSWGAGCGSYFVPGWNCEKGNVWIDIRDLAENTYEVHTFER